MYNEKFQNILSNIKDGVLFYPCSGPDYDFPIKVFVPYVTKFYFVDLFEYNHLKYYNIRGNPDNEFKSYKSNSNFLKRQCQWKKAKRIGPIYSEHRYIPINKDNKKEKISFIKPGVRKETYLHLNSNTEFEVNYCRGYGIFAFFKFIDKLDVFFYRGDGLGEGGSGAFWNCKPSLSCVLSKLKDGGLYVTDGSNTMNRKSNFLKAYINNITITKPVKRYGFFWEKIENLYSDRYPLYAWQLKKNPEIDNWSNIEDNVKRAKRKFMHIV